MQLSLAFLCALVPLLVNAQTTLVTRTVEVTRVETVPASTPTDIAKTSAQPTSAPVPIDQQNAVDLTPVDPDAAGAEGDDTGAFTLSKGSLIAIIVCVSIVVVLGTSITVLWYVAKKRQWEVRKSLKRASRRLTGRLDNSKAKRQSRRSAVRMASPPGKNRKPQETRMQNIDVEKGVHQGEGRAKTTTKITSTFSVDSPTSKSWKQKLFQSGTPARQ